MSSTFDFADKAYNNDKYASEVYTSKRKTESTVTRKTGTSFAFGVLEQLTSTPSGSMTNEERAIFEQLLSGNSNYKELVKKFMQIYLTNTDVSTGDANLRLGKAVCSTTTGAMCRRDIYQYKFNNSNKLMTKLDGGDALGLPPYKYPNNVDVQTGIFPEMEDTDHTFDYDKGTYVGEVTLRTNGFYQINNCVNAAQKIVQNLFGPIFSYLDEWDLSLYMQEGIFTKRTKVSTGLTHDFPVRLDYRMFLDNPLYEEDGITPTIDEVEAKYPLTCAVSKVEDSAIGTSLNTENYFIEDSKDSKGWVPTKRQEADATAGVSKWWQFLRQYNADNENSMSIDGNYLFPLVVNKNDNDSTLTETLRFETLEECALSGYTCYTADGNFDCYPLTGTAFYKLLYHSTGNEIDDVEQLFSSLDSGEVSKNSKLYAVLAAIAPEAGIWDSISSPTVTTTGASNLSALQENISMSTRSESDISIGDFKIKGSRLLKMFLKKDQYAKSATSAANNADSSAIGNSILSDAISDASDGSSSSDSGASSMVPAASDNTVSAIYPKAKGLLPFTPFLFGGPIGQYDYASSLAYYTSILVPTSPVARLPTKSELEDTNSTEATSSRMRSATAINPKQSSAYAMSRTNGIYNSTVSKGVQSKAYPLKYKQVKCNKYNASDLARLGEAGNGWTKVAAEASYLPTKTVSCTQFWLASCLRSMKDQYGIKFVLSLKNANGDIADQIGFATKHKAALWEMSIDTNAKDAEASALTQVYALSSAFKTTLNPVVDAEKWKEYWNSHDGERKSLNYGEPDWQFSWWYFWYWWWGFYSDNDERARARMATYSRLIYEYKDGYTIKYYYDPIMTMIASTALAQGIHEEYVTVRMYDKNGKAVLVTLLATPHSALELKNSEGETSVGIQTRQFPVYSFWRRCGCRAGWSYAGTVARACYVEETTKSIPNYTFEIVEETKASESVVSNIDMASDEEPRIECNVYRHISQATNNLISSTPLYYAKSSLHPDNFAWQSGSRYSLVSGSTWWHDVDAVYASTISELRKGKQYIYITKRVNTTGTQKVTLQKKMWTWVPYWSWETSWKWGLGWWPIFFLLPVLRWRRSYKTVTRYEYSTLPCYGFFQDWFEDNNVNYQRILGGNDEALLTFFYNKKCNYQKTVNGSQVNYPGYSCLPITKKFYVDTIKYYLSWAQKKLAQFKSLFLGDDDLTPSEVWTFFQKVGDKNVYDAVTATTYTSKLKGLSDNVYYDRVLRLFYRYVYCTGWKDKSYKTLIAEVSDDLNNLASYFTSESDITNYPEKMDELYNMCHATSVATASASSNATNRYNMLFLYMEALTRVYQQYRKYFIIKRFNKTDGTYFQLRNLEKVLQYAKDASKESTPSTEERNSNYEVNFFDVQNSDAAKVSALSTLTPLELDYATDLYIKVDYASCSDSDVKTVTAEYDKNGKLTNVPGKYYGDYRVIKVPENGKWAYLPDDGLYYLTSDIINTKIASAAEDASNTVYSTTGKYANKTCLDIIAALEAADKTNSKIYSDVCLKYDETLASNLNGLLFYWTIVWDTVNGTSNGESNIDYNQYQHIKLQQLEAAKNARNTSTKAIVSCISFDIPYSLNSLDSLLSVDLSALDAQELACVVPKKADFWHVKVPKADNVQIKPIASLLDANVMLKPYTLPSYGLSIQGKFASTISPIRAISEEDLNNSMTAFAKAEVSGK